MKCLQGKRSLWVQESLFLSFKKQHSSEHSELHWTSRKCRCLPVVAIALPYMLEILALSQFTPAANQGWQVYAGSRYLTGFYHSKNRLA